MIFGILGAAKIADRSSVPAMHQAEGVEARLVAARSAERAGEFAARHDLQVAASYEDVLTDPDVTAVYVPLPNGLHHEWVLRALEAGKHVLCEKSLTGSYAQSRELVELAAERELVLVENFMCENHPQHEAVRSLLSSGDLGELRHLSLSFGFPPFPRDDQRNDASLAGGALNDAGAYCAFMSGYYVGRAPERVSASLGRQDYDVDVVGSALLHYGDGLTSSLSFGFLHDYRNEIRLWGSRGQIDIDRAFSIPADRLPSVTLTRNTERERLDVPAANQFVAQMERFARLCASPGARTAEYEKISAQAALLEAVRLSSARREDVALAEVTGS